MQVVLLIWTDGQRKIPLSMRLWQKGGKSKVELAQEMLFEANERGIQPKPFRPLPGVLQNTSSRIGRPSSVEGRDYTKTAP